VIEDPHVFMRHARLDVAEGGVWLADLRSTNGTFFDGRRLMAPVWLAAPSEFRVGQTTVRFTADEPTVVSGPPPAGPPAWAGPSTPAVGMPTVPPARGYVANDRDAVMITTTVIPRQQPKPKRSSLTT
jgi:hypothetical protein